MSNVAFIVGSGFSRLGRELRELETVRTPYGDTSSPVMIAELGRTEVYVIARHGIGHRWPPHKVNYRANVWALRDRGVRYCFGQNVVGGIARDLVPGVLAVPDDLIDYTWGRESSFDSGEEGVTHIEFTSPLSGIVREALESACAAERLPIHRGTCAVTQGPRLETAAEIDRLERDGCAMVGMTALPEAALAREAGLEYAILAGVVNHAAGRAPAGSSVHVEMLAVLDSVMQTSMRVLASAAAGLSKLDL
ncbi:MAG: S-methyl-5'-thioinosine phosphorylase [Gammaproteobacteria bacterium]|jgi:purine nucleoside phosphorylase